MGAGLEDRLAAELTTLAPTQPISITTAPSPQPAAWTGGATQVRHDDFTPTWITREQYEEHGPSLTLACRRPNQP
ncbi:hypothetical protein WKI71_43735 [Streptomyces sp. MS1.AVA.1]|uniref:Uncharacterized protein n=1 Tax=Streptomyces machairae TaxID=3134109 RepID=A0ABU8UV28_9ACTN